jgi:quercetin dioxygenase-like cupin family protein
MYYEPRNPVVFENHVQRDKMIGEGYLELLERAPESPNMRAQFAKFENSGSTRWHWHEGSQLLFGTQGEGFIEIEGLGTFDITVGTRVIVPPGVWHKHGGSGSGPFVHLAVTTGATQWEDAE